MKFGKWATAGVVGATAGAVVAAGAAFKKKADDTRGEEKREGYVNSYKEFEEKHNKLAEEIRSQKKEDKINHEEME